LSIRQNGKTARRQMFQAPAGITHEVSAAVQNKTNTLPSGFIFR